MGNLKKWRIREPVYVLCLISDKFLFQQVAFIGRTSVGKSSLINALLNQKKLVRTSKRPVRKMALEVIYHIIPVFSTPKSSHLLVILLIFLIGFGTVFCTAVRFWD